MHEQRKPTLLDTLDQLDELVVKSDEPKSWAIFVLGHAMGLAARAGWSVDELVKMGLVRSAEPDDGEKRTIGGR